MMAVHATMVSKDYHRSLRCVCIVKHCPRPILARRAKRHRTRSINVRLLIEFERAARKLAFTVNPFSSADARSVCCLSMHHREAPKRV